MASVIVSIVRIYEGFWIVNDYTLRVLFGYIDIDVFGRNTKRSQGRMNSQLKSFRLDIKYS